MKPIYTSKDSHNPHVFHLRSVSDFVEERRNLYMQHTQQTRRVLDELIVSGLFIEYIWIEREDLFVDHNNIATWTTRIFTHFPPELEWVAFSD